MLLMERHIKLDLMGNDVTLQQCDLLTIFDERYQRETIDEMP